MTHVFEAVAEEIDLAVDDEEAVVYLMGQLDGVDGWLLTVVGFEGFVVLLVVGGTDGCFYILGSLIEECEGFVIAIVIYEDDLFFCCTDEIGDERISVPHASGGEELFLGLLMGMDEERDLLFVLLKAVFYAKKAFIYMLLECDKMAVDGIALEKVLLQHTCCPNAELCTSLTFYAIAHGNNDI